MLKLHGVRLFQILYSSIIEMDATLVSFLPWGQAIGFKGVTLRESTSTPLPFIWSSPRVHRT